MESNLLNSEFSSAELISAPDTNSLTSSNRKLHYNLRAVLWLKAGRTAAR